MPCCREEDTAVVLWSDPTPAALSRFDISEMGGAGGLW